MPIKTRKVLISDVNQLLPLLSQLGYSISEEDLTARLGLYTHSTVDRAWVILDSKEEIVGCIAVHCYDLFHSKERYARITSLIVKDTHRRKGYGRRLIARAEKFAINRECTALELSSNMKRLKTGSHAFFDAMGYKNEGELATLYLRKFLTDISGPDI